jgi:hypothetical protein
VAPALFVFGAVPLTFGVLRILQLMGLSDVMPAAPVSSAIPLMIHIVGAFVYALLGAFQFSAGIRSRWPVWHRMAGRVLFGCGVLVAGSAVWLSIAHVALTPAGLLLLAFRLIFASAMLMALVLGLAAILRGDVSTHRAWMTRAYAIALGASTQMLVMTIAEILTGEPSEMNRSLLLGVSWLINLAFAEWRIRRPARKRA